MQDIFATLLKAENLAGAASDLQGRTYGLTLGVVSDTQDPLNLARVKALLPSKGANYETDWLSRLVLNPGILQTIVEKGDTIAVLFIDGDPHSGVYLGVLNNLVNPPQADLETFVLGVGNSLLTVAPDNISMAVGSVSLVISDGSVQITGATDFSVNGKQVATIDATTNNGKVVTRGW